ncbi:MAG TPA: hypothetical protein PK821_08110, partial [Victivallales bacterium]|nr:hypothetical protein [Victivallales bacterium]
MHFKDHTDYGSRIKPLKRWLKNRLVGESSGNTMDSRGDESLYKPSRLGTAKCSLRTVLAGENKAFTLEYIAGKEELPAGTKIKFWMPGQ